MPSVDDRRAAVVLTVLAAAGLVVRVLLGAGAAPGAVAYRAASGARPVRDSVAARATRLTRPLGRQEKIDLDRASAEELARLPRIGPALAARIVAFREEHGPFGSLDGLDRVPGIGPTHMESVRPHAVFTGTPRGARTALHGVPLVSLNTASMNELTQLPGIGRARAGAIVEDRRRHGPYRKLEDLTRVRGIGLQTVERLRGRVRVP